MYRTVYDDFVRRSFSVEIRSFFERRCKRLFAVDAKRKTAWRNSDLFSDDVYKYINLEECTFKRTSKGASAIKSVEEQINFLRGNK